MKPAPQWPQIIRERVDSEFKNAAVRFAVIEGVNIRVQVAEHDSGAVCFQQAGDFDGSFAAFYVWARFVTESDTPVITDFGGYLS